MKKTLLLILFPLLSFSQTKIGEDILGKYAASTNMTPIFGCNVAISGDGNVVSIGDDNYANWAGTAWIYKNTAGNWNLLGQKFSTGDTGDGKGSSVSLSDDGNTVAVGSSQDARNYGTVGYTQVFQNINGTWTQIGLDIKGKLAREYSGSSVSLSGDGSTVAIGSPGNSDKIFNQGCVRVYKNVGGIWTQVGADLYGNVSGGSFGLKVSLSSDGQTMAIGSSKDSFYVYKNIAGTWTLVGEFEGVYYNFCLSSDGSTIAAVSYFMTTDKETGSDIRLRYVKMMRFINGSWTQVGTNKVQKYRLDGAGDSISLSGDGSILAIGAAGATKWLGDEFGTVSVYQENAGDWTQIGVDILGKKNYDLKGGQIMLSKNGNKLLIGYPYDDNSVGVDAGAIRVYDLSPVLNTNSFVMSNSVIYPNPASETVNISLAEGLALEKVNIYNTLGQLLKTEKSTSININYLSKGVYYFEIITDKGKASKTIVVK
ncbi:T9SS type A sorting domain-containing protein [Flavobacterium sp. Root186]|uniref:T9SS type A sorting domain-containing protein n=1 Tax=Flavobacterium sp. Root186 TaxID=1736485 RepID=UPI0006F4CBBD|nr:T9SS type A sorting domain-containing protein [Flavobacterium sp. Root186]KRB54810.1 hypothetical protein ASD98_17390 [Flavobacterium sp. Root186]